MSRAVKIAIVGSGPSGFYAAEALFRQLDDVAVDVYEKLPAPYGLVRYGVAPDHPKLKSVCKVFDGIAASPGFRYLGNVELGRDVSLAQLRAHYRAVIIACGMPASRMPGIPGEDLPGSHAAADFVAWYNGHPDHAQREFRFDCERAVVLGHGNVALDIARVLLKPVDELRRTDIATSALEQLATSRITDVHVIGRRGPAQAKFVSKELREFASLPSCTPVVRCTELALPEQTSAAIAKLREKQAIMKLLHEFSCTPVSEPRQCHFRFLRSPCAIEGRERVERIRLERNALEGDYPRTAAKGLGDYEQLECGLVLHSIGYRGVQLAGLPLESGSGVIPNIAGRVLDGREPLAGVYVTGWIKRGPTGIIGSNRADSLETVHSLVEDLPSLPAPAYGSSDLPTELAGNGHRTVSFDDWTYIRQAENTLGASSGAAAVKFTRVDDMLRCLDQAAAPPRDTR